MLARVDLVQRWQRQAVGPHPNGALPRICCARGAKAEDMVDGASRSGQARTWVRSRSLRGGGRVPTSDEGPDEGVIEQCLIGGVSRRENPLVIAAPLDPVHDYLRMGVVLDDG